MGPKFCADAIQAANAKIDEAAAEVDTVEVLVGDDEFFVGSCCSFGCTRESFMDFFWNDERLDKLDKFRDFFEI